MKRSDKVKRAIFLILGMICIFFPEHISLALPYLLGGAMAAVGAWIAAGYLKEKRFLEGTSDDLAYGVILFIMGAVFMLKGSRTLGAVGVTWAMIGLRKASRSLTDAIGRIYRKEPYILPVLEFLLRITLALALLLDPFEKISGHITLLGLEMIVINIPFAKPVLPERNEDKGDFRFKICQERKAEEGIKEK